jgi:SAM-dependent methyltransferase
MPKIGGEPGASPWKAAVALLVLVLAGGRGVGASAADLSRLNEEFTKQEKIYRSRGAEVPGGYVTYRTLAAYAELLPSGFDTALRRLDSKDRWLDIGAGGGQAILDYYAENDTVSRGKARAVALSIEDRRTDEWRQRAAKPGGAGMRYLFGKRLREYSYEELGKFQIITDVYGGFSYTENLSLFLERVFGLLETNGSFYTLLASVRLENGKDDPDKVWYLTELVDAAGRDVKVCSWLKGLPCMKVACESKSDWHTPTELIHVRKVCGNVAVPRTKLLLYEAGQPPGRRFQLEP